MSIDQETLTVANVEIDIVRKDIKHMHLAVYPPKGRIRLSAPRHTDPELLRLFAISKLGWIKNHIKRFEEQKRETRRQFVSGESHYYQGRRYIIEVIEHDGSNKVELIGTKRLRMHMRPGTSTEQRDRIMKEWYRRRLKAQIPELLAKWEKVVGVKAEEWGVKKMRTKWGACNIEARRIWLNLELAKKPVHCLEYVIVHELVHLRVRNHNDQFIFLLDQFMPKWRLYRDELNALPLEAGKALMS